MSYVKKKVGDEFETPKGWLETRNVGGYKFAFAPDGLYVCGKGQFNLTTAPIMPCTVMPITKERIDQLKVREDANEANIGHVFEYEDNTVYYLVTYGIDADEESSGTFVFDNLNTALEMIGTMTHYKADAFFKEEE